MGDVSSLVQALEWHSQAGLGMGTAWVQLMTEARTIFVLISAQPVGATFVKSQHSRTGAPLWCHAMKIWPRNVKSRSGKKDDYIDDNINCQIKQCLAPSSYNNFFRLWIILIRLFLQVCLSMGVHQLHWQSWWLWPHPRYCLWEC